MNREQFFQELRAALHRGGFTPQPEQDESLPVEWDIAIFKAIPHKRHLRKPA